MSRCLPLVLALGFAASAHAEPAGRAQALSVRELAHGVWVHAPEIAEATPDNRGDIANIGFVIGTRCAAVIDTGGSRAVGEALLAALRRRTALPVCYVINTHVHPDHVFGNSAFTAAGTQFVGHARLPAAMAARADSYHRTLAEQVGPEAAELSPLVPPDLGVEIGHPQRLDLGGRELVVEAWPTAHTDSDLTVTDSGSNTLWTGDLLFVEHVPVLDGSLRGWLDALVTLADRHPAHVVPGHGRPDPDWQGALAEEARYLHVIASDVRAALKINRTLTQTLERAGLSERGRWRLFQDYHLRNITACYTELEWED